METPVASLTHAEDTLLRALRITDGRSITTHDGINDGVEDLTKPNPRLTHALSLYSQSSFAGVLDERCLPSSAGSSLPSRY